MAEAIALWNRRAQPATTGELTVKLPPLHYYSPLLGGPRDRELEYWPCSEVIDALAKAGIKVEP
jgi:hypothetical protein